MSVLPPDSSQIHLLLSFLIATAFIWPLSLCICILVAVPGWGSLPLSPTSGVISLNDNSDCVTLGLEILIPSLSFKVDSTSSACHSGPFLVGPWLLFAHPPLCPSFVTCSVIFPYCLKNAMLCAARGPRKLSSVQHSSQPQPSYIAFISALSVWGVIVRDPCHRRPPAPL